MTIYAQLYIMYSCKTIAQYKAEYAHFLTLCKSQPFIEYFIRTWHNNEFYLHWTCIYRGHSYSDWCTNNVCEGMFSHLQNMIGKNYTQMDVFLDALLPVLNRQELKSSFAKALPKSFL